jgi:hypothetical protein
MTNNLENKRDFENIILAFCVIGIILALLFVVYQGGQESQLLEAHAKLHQNPAEHGDCFACTFEEWEVE